MGLIAPVSIRGERTRVRVKRPSERRSSSRSATRALDVLEYFGEVRRPLRAIEISKVLGMHPSTTNQLLKTMVDSAHLVFDAKQKTYLPSQRLAEFSDWITATYGAGGTLRGLLREVHARTGMVVTMSTANDLFMQVVDLVLPAGQQTERGLRISMFGSVVGSAYLSMLDAREVRRLALRARVPTSQVPAVLAGVEQIRQSGYADGRSADSDFWSIAMPLPMRAANVRTVLGLAGPPHEVQRNLQRFREIMSESIDRWLTRSGTDRRNE